MVKLTILHEGLSRIRANTPVGSKDAKLPRKMQHLSLGGLHGDFMRNYEK
jgi:hypothetical protein